MTQRPSFRFSGPVLGSCDPLALAEFYSQLLGWPIAERYVAGAEPDAQDWAILRSPTSPQKLEFQYEPYATAPTWPPVAGAQQMLMHLDFGVPDLDAATAWACATGATVAHYQPQDGVRVMLDPDGNPFCLFHDG